MKNIILLAVLGVVFVTHGESSPCNLPVVGAITGHLTVCVGSIITLADTSTGGIWSSSDTSIAEVSALGVVTGAAAGNDTIIYSVTNICGTSKAIFPIVVNALPTIQAVSNQTVCAGEPIAAVNFSGDLPGAGYNWTNNVPTIGLPSSGSGNIAAFTTVNTGTAPLVATVTATPVSSPGFAYITNYHNSISVINTYTNTVTDTIAIGGYPQGISVSPDGSKVYVANIISGSLINGTVLVINTSTNLVVDTITVGIAPFGVAVSPDGNKVYVANNYSGTVSVINTATNLVVDTITVGSNPIGLAVSPDGSKVYVANAVSGTVSVIGTITNTVNATIPAIQDAHGIAVSPDGSKVYVTSGSDTVSVINASTNFVTAKIIVANPYSVVVSPDGSKVYVSSYDTVSVINTSTNLVAAKIVVGSGGGAGISVSPDGSKVYVVNQYDSSVSVINTSTNTVTHTIPVGLSPSSFGNFVIGSIGCAGLPITFTVTVNPKPLAGITGLAASCDSVSLTATGGSSYAWSGGGRPGIVTNTFTSSGTYIVTVTNSNSCSATASQAVTVYQPSTSQFSHNTCAGTPYNFNNLNLNTGGTYYDTLQTIHGCDSIVTLNLTVNNGAQTAIRDTACNGTVIMFNGRGLTSAGVYKDTLQTVFGCDSVVTLTLLFDSLPQPTVTRSGDTLQTQVFATYQWLRNGFDLNDGTTQSIIIQQNGNYSVVVTGPNGCSDTSEVLSVTTLGVQDVTNAYGVKLYPNPNTGSFILEFTDDVVRDVEVTDAVGRTVMAPAKVSRQQNFNLEELSAGIYIVRINQQGQVQSLKFTLVR